VHAKICAHWNGIIRNVWIILRYCYAKSVHACSETISVKKLIFLCFGLISNFNYAQELDKNRIGANLLALKPVNMRSYTFHLFIPHGLSYTRVLKEFSLRSSLNIYKYSHYTDNKNCFDCYYGTTKITGVETKAGIQKELVRKRFLFAVGIDLSFSRLRRLEDFEGGFSGAGYRSDEILLGYGLNPFFGIGFLAAKRILVSTETGYVFRMLNVDDQISHTKELSKEHFYVPIQSLTVHWSF